MKITRVLTKSDLIRFIKLSYQIYKNDPVQVPPLLDEQKSQFDAKRNPTLDHCKYALFLLEEDGNLIGRIAAFIDLIALETWKEPIGLFGYYECIENDTASLALTNVNVLLKGMKGRLLPFGWLKLLRGLPKLTSYRLFALGVVPEYHGKGIDSFIYRALCESFYTTDIWMEINYVLEDNNPMNNAIRKLNAKPLRRYRIYQKEI